MSDKRKSIDFFNLRVFKHVDEDGNEWFAVHDAYYSYDDKENPHSFSATPTTVVGGNLDWLKGHIEKINRAYERPVLEVPEFNKFQKN